MTDWDGASYRQVNTLQQWLAARVLEDVDLDGVHSLLDVGCGDGRVTEALADRLPGGRCVGIDPSPRMVAVAPARDGLTFEVGDVRAMAFHDEFDLVVSFNALHWVPELGPALAAIATALHRPGRALLVFVCGGPRRSLEDVAMAVAGSAAWAGFFRGFEVPYIHPDPDAWRADVEASGMRVDGLRVDDLSWDFGSRDTFTQWCTVGCGSWTSQIPDVDVPRFMDDVVEAYATETGSDQIFRFMQLVGSVSRPDSASR